MMLMELIFFLVITKYWQPIAKPTKSRIFVVLWGMQLAYLLKFTLKTPFYTAMIRIIIALLLGFCCFTVQAQTSGCVGMASISVTIEECVGIEEVWESSQIDLYPNPFRDALHIVLPSDLLSAPCHISITDINGRVLYGTTAQQSTVELPTSTLAKGMYIVSVQNGSQYFRRKIAKY